MLSALRRNSRNAIIYVLFGIIIAVFIINFGPGSKGCGGGAAGSTYAAKVAGSTVSEQDFRFAYIALGGTEVPGQMQRERRLKEFVMDKLIERELFALQAEKLGFAVSDKEVEDMIADGRMIVMGVPRRVDSYVYKDGKFDYERFKMVAQNRLGVSVMRFIDIEKRELLANKVRELMKMGTKVSLDEVKADYDAKGLQVNLEFARWMPRRYEDEIGEPTAAEIDAYVKAHADELKKAYDERAFLYKKIDKQAKLRHLIIDAPKDGPAEQIKNMQVKIDQAAAKLKAGASWDEVVKQYSTEDRTKNRGGLIGWRKKGFTGLGEALDAKVFAAQGKIKPGALIGPEKTDRGWELVKVEDFREGDVPLEVAQREIAEEKVREEKAKAKAKADAEAVMAKVKAGEPLDKIIPKEPPAQSDEEKRTRSLLARLTEPPKLMETGPFPRRGDMVPEIGASPELAKKAFELKPGEVAGPIEVAGGYAIVRLKDRKEPDSADFEKRKPEIVREYERTKFAEVLDSWSKQRCTEVKDDGRIRVNDEILSYEGMLPGKAQVELPKMKYEPCAGTKLF
jgi:parvulin-like peptidyl-prolyl isomerase